MFLMFPLLNHKQQRISSAENYFKFLKQLTNEFVLF